MTTNNVLVDQQSGFRSQHSTETTLLSSANEWLYNMDRGLFTGVLFLDLKKAFDTVDTIKNTRCATRIHNKVSETFSDRKFFI